MIKQFNFYDIYGYLLPGMMLFVLLWMPIGILTQSWPGQDLSKAIFLAALAYVAGHILQTVANSVVPSTVVDPAKQRRFPSELLMDKSNTRFTATFKVRVAAAVEKMFGLDLAVDRDGTGNDTVSADRQTAFFHARSYLIAKKAAQYAEQFEGMYVMMRGLGCAFCAGGAYFAGWALSVRSNGKMDCVAPVFIFTALGAALICALIAFFRESVRKAQIGF